MFYLLLSIICSASIAIIMRLSKDKIKNNMSMFFFNYLMCSFLAFIFIDKNISLKSEEGTSLLIILGAIAGFLFLFNFILMQTNINKNGMVLGTIFTKLGIIISTLIAIIFFKEKPTLFQIIGLLLVIVSIVVIHYEKNNVDNNKYYYLLIILLIVSGITDSMANIFDKIANTNLKEYYLLFNFVFALIFALILWIIKKQSITTKDILYGVLIGIPNFFSTYFLLLALHNISAIIVYPVYSVSGIVIISIIGLIFFKEKINMAKLIGIFIAIMALVLLNI